MYSAATVSGAHLNPAVSIGLAATGSFPWVSVPGYIAGQFAGAMAGAALVWLPYLPHWGLTADQGRKLMVFCTVPAVRHSACNLLSEIVGTFMLLFGIFTIKGASLDSGTPQAVPLSLGALGALPVAVLIWAIGLSLGGPTGYAINPARDLGPRIVHAILPMVGKGGSDWRYAWIPVIGPVVGALLAAFLYVALGSF